MTVPLNGQLGEGKTKVIEEFIAASREAVRELSTGHRLAHILDLGTWSDQDGNGTRHPSARTINRLQLQMTTTNGQGWRAIVPGCRHRQRSKQIEQGGSCTGFGPDAGIQRPARWAT